jgi:uncharacterized protein (DUF58 family)
VHISSLLDPAVLSSIADLELVARVTVDGTVSGLHRSPFHGYSAEFSQHRPYRAGDDLKYLDWKVLARTDRLYSRQFRETTSMSVMLVVDTSASMAFPAHGLSKFRYAAVTAASLAYLIVSQGDAVGLMSMAGGSLVYLPARGGRPHLRSLIAQIQRLEPAGVWAPERVIARGAELLKRRGVVMVLSDFYDAEAATFRELRRTHRRGHDVAMLQVVSGDEMAFPYRGDIEFEDLESGERRVVDAGSIAAGYREAVNGFLARCRRQAGRDGLDYALLDTAVPPERALRRYLLRRSTAQSARGGGRRPQ